MIDTTEMEVDKKRKEIAKEADRYGQKTDMAEPTINDYEEALSEVTNQYINAVNVLIAEKSELEKAEFQQITDLLRTKANQVDGIQTQETDEKKQQLVSLREMQDLTTGFIEEVTQEHNETIGNISKENNIAVVNKQNFFQKVISIITDKINGKNKFEDSVIKPLQQKTEKIKREDVPNVKEKTEKSIIDRLKELYNEGKEKIGEALKSKEFKQLLNIAINGARPILMATFGAKGAIISTALSVATENLIQDRENNSKNIGGLIQE